MKYPTVAVVTTLALGLSACGGAEGGVQAGSQGQSATATGTTSSPAGPGSSTGPSTTTGGGEDTTPTPNTGGNGGSSRGGSANEGLPPPVPRHERYPHGDTSIQTYGHRGSGADMQQIARTVERFYAAVAADDGARVCSLLSSGIAQTIIQTFGRSPQLQNKDCARVIALLFKSRLGVSAAQRAEVHVTSVRVKGSKGFALLHSKLTPHGEIPMVREGGVWKVNAISGSELP